MVVNAVAGGEQRMAWFQVAVLACTGRWRGWIRHGSAVVERYFSDQGHGTAAPQGSLATHPDPNCDCAAWVWPTIAAMIPHSQTAVQLVGPDRLALNSAKPIPAPGPRQILAQVECVGLCASDMKLLHQFDRHARKTPVLAHLGADVLAGIPSYVPDGAPTVPGH